MKTMTDRPKRHWSEAPPLFSAGRVRDYEPHAVGLIAHPAGKHDLMPPRRPHLAVVLYLWKFRAELCVPTMGRRRWHAALVASGGSAWDLPKDSHLYRSHPRDRIAA